MQDYRNLRVWQRAHQMTVDAYALPKHFQKPEAWPLRVQIQRAAIPALGTRCPRFARCWRALSKHCSN